MLTDENLDVPGILVQHTIHKKKKWCGCGDELRSEEDIKTGECWICRSL